MSQQKQQSTSPAPKDVKNQIPPPLFQAKRGSRTSSHTPLLNIAKLISHTEFNQIHSLNTSPFTPNICNLARAGRCFGLSSAPRVLTKLMKIPQSL